VEGRKEFLEIASMVKEAGATMLRGGAFKPRTSPYSFQGLEQEGLEILAEARTLTGLPVVTEIVDPRIVELVLNMQICFKSGPETCRTFFCSGNWAR
jgi:3-deoxy-7-phosphoheptulonate synthase